MNKEKVYITYYECALRPSVGHFCLHYKKPFRTVSGAIALDDLKKIYPETPIVYINEVEVKYLGTNLKTIITHGGIIIK